MDKDAESAMQRLAERIRVSSKSDWMSLIEIVVQVRSSRASPPEILRVSFNGINQAGISAKTVAFDILVRLRYFAVVSIMMPMKR